ncbi:MAG: lytic transglycosylase domain-containing protein [Gemmatimonadaceae bacterium]|nr:lytic transglycosylase domain-containing protein [Chitinophagaceae bacterium]
MNKHLLLSLFGMVLASLTMAQNTVALETFATRDTSTDKAVTVISKQAVAAEQKKGFHDLFDAENTAGPRLNPRAISFVEDYMEANARDLESMKSWGRPYFNMMDAVLVSYNLPKELKYLAVIESKLKKTATSWAGAVGPWQFMPATAICLGLKVNRKVDERTNYVKSTHAAARYLTDLYEEYGDWLLVIAAYNGGPGNVNRAIRKSGSRNFWVLQYHLPAESRNHVKKFIGTHYIFEGQGGMTTLTKAETAEHYGINSVFASNRKLSTEESAAAKAQVISGKYLSVIIAKHTMMDLMNFNRYNPEFDKSMSSSSNSYELKLPADKMDLFNANKYQILNESIQMMLSIAKAESAMPEETETAAGRAKR